MGRRYREFSRVAMPGRREEIVADTSVLIDGRKVVQRIHSQVTNAYKDVIMSGDPVDDIAAILDARKTVMRHDQRDHGPKPVPKPTRRQLSQAEILASCRSCGGRGFVVDEWDYEHVCKCRS